MPETTLDSTDKMDEETSCTRLLWLVELETALDSVDETLETTLEIDKIDEEAT